MRLSGVGTRAGIQNPLDYRLVGININQEDMPWWWVGVMNWIAMVDDMLQCPGQQGPAKREYCKLLLKEGKLHDIYKAYEGYVAYYEGYVAGTYK